MSTVRSCLECRRRKIRCDKTWPCSYCVKTRNQCKYPSVEGSSSSVQRQDAPAAGPSSAAPDAASRIQALEAQVEQLTSRLSNVESWNSERAMLSVQQPTAASMETWLVHPAFETPATPPTSSAFALRLSPQSEVPTPQWNVDLARQLWQVYLADIDPCLKIVDHQYVEAALDAYPEVEPHSMAVLLAIGFAVTSCKNPSALAEYQGYAKALEKALQSAKVLTQPSIATLQALIIYLSCGRLNMDQEYLCTMLLLLVRLASKLRLDQDPAELGFDPTECEHRRRLYWHLITLDIRTAEACGSTPLIISRDIKTQMPLGWRDVSLGALGTSIAGSIEPFDPPGHAPCTFYAIMGFEMAKIARQVLFALTPTGEPGIPQFQVQQRNQADQLHQALLSQYGKSCNCVDSALCRFTIQWCSIYWTRLKLLVAHGNKLFLRQVSDESAFDEERDLLACIGILERVERLRADAEYARWAWLWQNCVEWDASAIALCMIASGKCSYEVVSRAWIALDTFFGMRIGEVCADPCHRKRWRELVAFRDWVRTAGDSSNFPPVSHSREVSMSDEG